MVYSKSRGIPIRKPGRAHEQQRRLVLDEFTLSQSVQCLSISSVRKLDEHQAMLCKLVAT